MNQTKLKSSTNSVPYGNKEIEIRQWISTMINSNIPEDQDLCTLLNDGVYLCKLMKIIQPDSIPKINYFPNQSKKNFWKIKENIFFFTAAVLEYGVPKHSCFEVFHLCDQNIKPDPEIVLITLETLKGLYFKKKSTTPVEPSSSISSDSFLPLISRYERQKTHKPKSESPTMSSTTSPRTSVHSSNSPRTSVHSSNSPRFQASSSTSPRTSVHSSNSPRFQGPSSPAQKPLVPSQNQTEQDNLPPMPSPHKARRTTEYKTPKNIPRSPKSRSKDAESSVSSSSSSSSSSSRRRSNSSLSTSPSPSLPPSLSVSSSKLPRHRHSNDSGDSDSKSPKREKESSPKVKPPLKPDFSFKRLANVVQTNEGKEYKLTGTSKMPIEKAIICIQSLWRRNRAQLLFFQRLRAQAYRDRVAEEILLTEKTYVSNLETLIQTFLVPFQTQHSEQLKSIISSLNIIYKINVSFLEKLTVRMEQWSSHQRIADIFLDSISLLKIYTQYVRDYDKTVTTIINLKSNSQSFSDHLDALTNKYDGLEITSFLIQPIQRIPRYDLLLRELVRYTWTDHQDYEALVQAQNEIKKVAQYVDDQKKRAENVLKVIEIQSSMVDCVHLAAPHRRFFFEGVLSVLDDNKYSERICFLFNDCFVTSKPAGGVQSSAVDVVSSIFNQKKVQKKRIPVFKFKKIYYLKPEYNMSVSNQRQSISINSSQGEVIMELRAVTPSEQELWKNNFAQAFKDLQNSSESLSRIQSDKETPMDQVSPRKASAISPRIQGLKTVMKNII